MVFEHHQRHVRLIGALLSFAAVSAHADTAQAIMTDSSRGNCIICHRIPLEGVPTGAFGNLGPALAHVGSRLRRDQIRARIVDARTIFPLTIMPPYGTTLGLYRVQRQYQGRTILTDVEIELVVTYLSGLK
jgi:sulfur-oxidizing protein SoxX